MPAFCTACGAQLKAEDRFCTQCGAARRYQSSPVAPGAAERGARSPARGPLGLMAAVLGAGLAAGAVYWGLRVQTPPAPGLAPLAAAPDAGAPAAGFKAVSPPQAPVPPSPSVAISREPPTARPPVDGSPTQVGTSGSARTIAAPPPATTKGLWIFSSGEDGAQLMFKSDPVAEDAPLRFACNLDDGVVWALGRAVLDGKVEALADQPSGLDMTIFGENNAGIVVRGYPASAPGETAIAWETPRSRSLMRAFAAPDFGVRGPGLLIKASDGDHAENLSAFARVCPPVDTDASDKLGWGTQTSRRYGYRLDIPKGLLRIVAGDRLVRRYASDSGDSELVVQNRTNATDQPLGAAIVDETPRLDKLVYERRTNAFVVLSGFAGDRIIYYKARTSCGGADIVSFTLSYKIQSREVYDPIAARMSKSFDRTASTDGASLCPP